MFPGHICLGKSTKNTTKCRRVINISTCSHKYIDGCDTRYPCSEFEVILI